MKKLIFIAGMSRAGSMWTYNVTRRLLESSGYIPLPERIPADDREAIDEMTSTDPGEKGVFCIKTHRRIDPIHPDMRIICPYRDVRDAMYSYMKFMKCPFERALLAARGMMENVDYYLLKGKTNVLPLQYDRIINKPAGVIQCIAGFLKLEPSEVEVTEIADAYSRENVKKYLKRLDDIKVDKEGQLIDYKEIARYTTMPRLDGSYRIYDNSTGFQSSHITTGKEGEWRQKLDRGQQKALIKVTAQWLKRYKFPI